MKRKDKTLLIILDGTQAALPTFLTQTDVKQMRTKALQQHIYRTIHIIITNASKQLHIIIYAYQLGLIATLALKPATHPNTPTPTQPSHTHTHTHKS